MAQQQEAAAAVAVAGHHGGATSCSGCRQAAERLQAQEVATARLRRNLAVLKQKLLASSPLIDRCKLADSARAASESAAAGARQELAGVKAQLDHQLQLSNQYRDQVARLEAQISALRSTLATPTRGLASRLASRAGTPAPAQAGSATATGFVTAATVADEQEELVARLRAQIESQNSVIARQTLELQQLATQQIEAAEAASERELNRVSEKLRKKENELSAVQEKLRLAKSQESFFRQELKSERQRFAAAESEIQRLQGRLQSLLATGAGGSISGAASSPGDSSLTGVRLHDRQTPNSWDSFDDSHFPSDAPTPLILPEHMPPTPSTRATSPSFFLATAALSERAAAANSPVPRRRRLSTEEDDEVSQLAGPSSAARLRPRFPSPSPQPSSITTAPASATVPAINALTIERVRAERLQQQLAEEKAQREQLQLQLSQLQANRAREAAAPLSTAAAPKPRIVLPPRKSVAAAADAPLSNVNITAQAGLPPAAAVANAAPEPSPESTSSSASASASKATAVLPRAPVNASEHKAAALGEPAESTSKASAGPASATPAASRAGVKERQQKRSGPASQPPSAPTARDGGFTQTDEVPLLPDKARPVVTSTTVPADADSPASSATAAQPAPKRPRLQSKSQAPVAEALGSSEQAAVALPAAGAAAAVAAIASSKSRKSAAETPLPAQREAMSLVPKPAQRLARVLGGRQSGLRAANALEELNLGAIDAMLTDATYPVSLDDVVLDQETGETLGQMLHVYRANEEQRARDGDSTSNAHLAASSAAHADAGATQAEIVGSLSEAAVQQNCHRACLAVVTGSSVAVAAAPAALGFPLLQFDLEPVNGAPDLRSARALTCLAYFWQAAVHHVQQYPGATAALAAALAQLICSYPASVRREALERWQADIVQGTWQPVPIVGRPPSTFASRAIVGLLVSALSLVHNASGDGSAEYDETLLQLLARLLLSKEPGRRTAAYDLVLSTRRLSQLLLSAEQPDSASSSDLGLSSRLQALRLGLGLLCSQHIHAWPDAVAGLPREPALLEAKATANVQRWRDFLLAARGASLSSTQAELIHQAIRIVARQLGGAWSETVLLGTEHSKATLLSKISSDHASQSDVQVTIFETVLRSCTGSLADRAVAARLRSSAEELIADDTVPGNLRMALARVLQSER